MKVMKLKKRALVVDDEPSLRTVCCRVLRSEGFDTDATDDGEMAWNMISEGDYDLLIIDLRLPTMNGVQLYDKLKDKYPELVHRLIFTSGDVMSTDTQLFLSNKLPFLSKPFTISDLKAKIKEVSKNSV